MAPPRRRSYGLARSGLPGLVRNLGCDPEPIFSALGFKLAQFADTDAKLS
jgi:hypothetical protein